MAIQAALITMSCPARLRTWTVDPWMPASVTAWSWRRVLQVEHRGDHPPPRTRAASRLGGGTEQAPVLPAIRRPVAGGSLDTRSRAASALRMSRREMLGKRQVAAPLMAQRAAHGALRPAHRRLQPGEGVGVQLAGLRLSRKPQRPSQGQFGHETLVLGFALIAPAASRPGQHRAVRRQRGRQVAPCGHW
jgi:hypothetical protein